ncbi:MAG: hypothetical protein GY867_10585 [bacterium]|nr:hypothetical protein [bacterium]
MRGSPTPSPRKKKLSFFELVAALAFEHFSRQQVDIAVIETGLGGRLDATNVLDPVATIITDISLDHAEILGDTLDKIAYEKAGIIKPGVPCVIGQLVPEARKVIEKVCRQRKAPRAALRRGDYRFSARGQGLDFLRKGLQFKRLAPSLPGRHQLQNCALALKTVEVLREKGFSIPKQAVEFGVKNTVWPGRFQVLTNGASSPTLVLDVGHNEAGVAAFVETFDRVFPGRRCRVLMGFVRRKQHQRMIDHLATIAREFRLVPLSTRRTVDIRDMMADLDWRGVPVKRSASLKTGYSALSKEASPDDIIAVLGSHYLVGEFLAKYADR